MEVVRAKQETIVEKKAPKRGKMGPKGPYSHFLEAFFYTIVVCLALITIILSVVLREAAQV